MRGQGYHWFRPESGRFDKEGYVIFQSTENPLARRAIKDIGDYYQHLNVAKQELSEVLRSVANKEREKECNYLKLKVASLPEGATKTRAIQLIDEHMGKSPTAISALFNLVLQSEQQMANLMKDVGTRGSDILKNSVYSRGFDTYLRQYFKSTQLGIGYGARSYQQGDSFLNGNLSFSDLVQQYIDSIFSTQIPKDLASTAETFRQQLISRYTNNGVLGEFFRKHLKTPITPAAISRALASGGVKTTKTGKSRSLRASIDAAIQNQLKGIDLEMVITADTKGSAVRTVHTGDRNKKTDVLILDAIDESVIVDLDFADSFAGKNLDQILDLGVATANSAISELSRVFAIAVSAKDYRSMRDFQVSSSKFVNSSERIQSITQGSLLGDGTDFIDNLAFYLNNSVPGAMLEGSRDQILDNIAYLAASFMFDDITSIFTGTSEDGMLHLYNINGIYHSLSELLMHASSEVLAVNPTATVDVSYMYTSPVIQEVEDDYYNGNYPDPDGVKATWDRVRDTVNQTPLDIKLRRDAILQMSNSLRILLG